VITTAAATFRAHVHLQIALTAFILGLIFKQYAHLQIALTAFGIIRRATTAYGTHDAPQ